MKRTKLLALVLIVVAFQGRAESTRAQTHSGIEKPSATQPALTETQLQEIKRIKSASQRKAALPALRLAGIVRKIYLNMLADKPDERLRAKLSAELRTTSWELLVIKGQAIRETVNVLTPEQKQLIKSEMRKPGAPADLEELIERTFGLHEDR